MSAARGRPGPGPVDETVLQALLADARRVEAAAMRLRAAAAHERRNGSAVLDAIGGSATGADKEAYGAVTGCAQAMTLAADQMQQLAAHVQRAVAHAHRPRP
ncbi:MAG: hypothetical protein JHC95_09870 [Solirubrobacteraceae bacterium]|nr:hypothetical protein [Solirubrobacteraceae bacterium]